MAKDFIRYDLHVQDALRGVVRRVLADVVRDGLPGEHYFYITFRTQHPGVRLSNRMRAEYPEEMTIVLQHQFWDLAVTDQAFEVGLSFKGIPEKLVVPFEAMTGFFDRSVDFGLRFESDVDIDDEDDPEDIADTDDAPQVTQGTFPRRIFEIAPEADASADTTPAPTPAGDDAAPAPRPASDDAEAPAAGDGAPTGDGDGKEDGGDPDDGGTDDTGAGAQVVQLDAFRKKNT